MYIIAMHLSMHETCFIISQKRDKTLKVVDTEKDPKFHQNGNFDFLKSCHKIKFNEM